MDLKLFSLMLLIVALSPHILGEVEGYQPCKDSSGGMCVKAGACPADKKPAHKPGNCGFGSECCYSYPSSEKSCQALGGSCMPENVCKGPKNNNAEDCRKGEVCCIQM